MQLINYILFGKYTDVLMYILNFSALLVLLQIIKEPLINKDEIENNGIVFKTQLIITILVVVAFIVYMFLEFGSYVLSILLIFYLFKFIISLMKPKKDFNEDQNMVCVISSVSYIIFFSNNMTNLYIQICDAIPHSYKELCLIIFILIKLLLLTYLVIFNILIIFSNLYNSPEIRILAKKIRDYCLKEHEFRFIYYSYKIYAKKKTKLAFFVDSGIFTILVLPTFIFNFLAINVLKLLFYFARKLILVIQRLSCFYINNNLLNKSISFLLIICLIITYFILIFSQDFFSAEVCDICNVIFTVFLIPLIFKQMEKFEKA